MSELLLLSGGIDSICLAAWRRPQLCLTVDYGQKAAEAEIAAASEVCAALALKHKVIRAPIPSLGCGDLVGGAASTASENTEFWPFRNQLLVTLGAMASMIHSCRRIVIGTVKSDSRHKDGTVDFVKRISDLLAMQEGELSLEAPAISLTTDELVQCSKVSASILGWAHSCHTANLACGQCRGCEKHSIAMRRLGWNR
jgi:7-cyano-7-deazaguanine synthase